MFGRLIAPSTWLFICACFAEFPSEIAWAQANQVPSSIPRTSPVLPSNPMAAPISLSRGVSGNAPLGVSLSVAPVNALTSGPQGPLAQALQASLVPAAAAAFPSAAGGAAQEPIQTPRIDQALIMATFPSGNAAAAESQPSLIKGKAVQSPSLDSMRQFAASLSAGGVSHRSLSAATQNSRYYFDGTLRMADSPTNDRQGTDAGRPIVNFGQNGAFHSRVIFLLDVFEKPASDKTVEFLQNIIDAGVHVVFMTWRPQKGPGSAEEILLGRLKYGRTNPIIAVSHNGGIISLHSKAKVPDFLVDPVKGFRPDDIAAFQAINAKLQQELKLTSLNESASPSLDSAFSYTVTLSRAVPAAQVAETRKTLLSRYNALLRGRHMPFRMAPHPDDPRAIIAHSMPLRISLRRVFASLDKVFHGENLLEHPGKFLILSDSKRSPKFTSSFPKGAEVQVVKTGEDVENTLGAVLRERTLHTVNIKLGKLREYVEYWRPYHGSYAADREPSAPGGGNPLGVQDRESHQKLAMYVGSVIYQFMGWFYKKVQRGQHRQTGNLEFLQSRIADMWNNPGQYNINVRKSLAEIMKSDAWKTMGPGYLDYAKTWFSNFWMREFGSTYSAAAKDVKHNLVSLGTGRKNLITLLFASPSTGRLYKIHTRIPRVMKHDTGEGRVLEAYAYRTGDETADDGEEIYAKTLAMALLVGHGRRGAYQDADGQWHITDNNWHHGSRFGPVLAKLHVNFEYLSSQRHWEFNPEDILKIEQNGAVSLGPLFDAMDKKTLAEALHQLIGPNDPMPADPRDVINMYLQRIIGLTHGPVVSELISTIEPMEADDEFAAHYEKEQELASADDLPKPKKPKDPAGTGSTGARRQTSAERRTTRPK